MKLLNQEIREILKAFPIRSQEDCGMNTKAVVKFFLPSTGWTWYVTEAEEDDQYGYLFFGLVINGFGEGELGYFGLSQLEEISVPLKVKIDGRIMEMGTVCIERDTFFVPTALKDIDSPYVQEYVRRFYKQ